MTHLANLPHSPSASSPASDKVSQAWHWRHNYRCVHNHRRAVFMAYVEPFNDLRHRPSIPDDVDLEGRDPNW